MARSFLAAIVSTAGLLAVALALLGEGDARRGLDRLAGLVAPGPAAPPATTGRPLAEPEEPERPPAAEAAPETAVTDLAEPAGEEADEPRYDLVRVEPTGEAVLAGRAAPASSVELLANGVVIGSSRTNASGEWVIVLAMPLSPGEHALTLRVKGPADERPVYGRETVAVSLAGNATEEPLVAVLSPETAVDILQMPDGEGKAAPSTDAGAASEPADAGAAGATVGAALAPAEAEPGERPAAEEGPVAIRSVEVGQDGLRVTGRGTAGRTVRIYLDGDLVGEARVGPDGGFTMVSAQVPAPGRYRVRADELSVAGRAVAARAEVSFDYVDLERLRPHGSEPGEPLPPPDPGSVRVVIERGDTLWNIARRHYGDGFRYTTIFRANFVQIQDPDLIFPGQVFDLPGARPASDATDG